MIKMANSLSALGKPIFNNRSSASPLPPVQLTTVHFGQHGQIKIMSYNMQDFHTKQDESQKFLKLAKLRTLAQIIQAHHPDIIVAQEVNNREAWLNFNEHFLNQEYPNIQFFQSSNHVQGLAFISREPYHFMVPQSHIHQKDEQGNHKFKWRDFPCVIVSKDIMGRWIPIFKIFNFHFKQGNHNSDRNTRLSEANHAAEIIKKAIDSDPSIGILVMGDSNASIDTKHGQEVLQSLKCDDKMSFLTPTHIPRAKRYYDYMLSRNIQFIEPPEIKGNPKQEPWSLASDHAPVVTTIQQPNLLVSYLARYQANQNKLEKVG